MIRRTVCCDYDNCQVEAALDDGALDGWLMLWWDGQPFHFCSFGCAMLQEHRRDQAVV